MKKKILLIFMVALLSFTVLAACSGNNHPGDDYDYPSEINTLKAECDADTVIDGRLTESRWQNLEWMEHTVPDVSIRVATSFSGHIRCGCFKGQTNHLQPALRRRG